MRSASVARGGAKHALSAWPAAARHVLSQRGPRRREMRSLSVACGGAKCALSVWPAAARNVLSQHGPRRRKVLSQAFKLLLLFFFLLAALLEKPNTGFAGNQNPQTQRAQE